MAVDFSRFSNTDFNTTPFQYVIFGKNGGLLEVELNEAQYLGFKRDYLALKSIGNVSIGATVSRDTDSGVTTFTGDFVIDGYAVCLNDCVINTNVGDTIYAKVSLETLTKDSTVKKNGYVDGETLSNTIIDNRVGIETSRRKAIKLELSTTHISGSIPIAFVNNSGVAEFSIINSSLSDILNRINSDIDELNSNLSDLQCSDVAGGKNLFDGKFINKVIDIGGNYTQRNLKEEFGLIKNVNGIIYTTFGGYFKKGTYTFSYTNDAWFSLNRIAIAGTNCYGSSEQVRKSHTWTQNVDGFTYFGIEGDDSETGLVDTPFSTTPDIMIEKGSTATAPYETYIPSVKILADEVSAQNESLSVIGKCKNLLNPTLQTTTVNGITCTDNGDGTYTLNGTATENTNFQIVQRGTAISVGTYKLVDIDGTDTTFFTYLDDIGVGTRSTDNKVFTVSSNATYGARIVVRKGIVLNNLVFKPMLTTNLNATYDDFVPYTGDGETLTADVAELKSEIDASYVSTVCGMSYSAENDEIIIETKVEPDATVADRVNFHDDALNGVFNTMTAVKQNIKETYSTKTEIADMFKPKLVHIKADKELGTIDNTANCVYGKICVLSFRFVAKVDIPSGTFMHSSYITYGDTDKVLRPLIKSYLIANKYNADNSLGESMTFSVESITFSDVGVTGGVIRPIQAIPAGTTLYITGAFVIRD